MKIFILFALIAVAYAEFKITTGDDLHTFRDQCKTELEISDEAIAQFKLWKFTDEKSPCYIHCMFKKMQLYTDEDSFLIDNLMTQLGQGRSDDIRPDVEKCAEFTDADHCQRAFKGFECFGKNNLQMIKTSVN